MHCVKSAFPKNFQKLEHFEALLAYIGPKEN